jgi:hypothetical protein
MLILGQSMQEPFFRLFWQGCGYFIKMASLVKLKPFCKVLDKMGVVVATFYFFKELWEINVTYALEVGDGINGRRQARALASYTRLLTASPIRALALDFQLII